MDRIEMLDCKNCIDKDTCERYQEGTFCTTFRNHPIESKPPRSPGKNRDCDTDDDW